MKELFSKKIGLDHPDEKGWRSAHWEPADEHVDKHSLFAGKSLLTLVHISDTHICDPQSPARLAFSDRLSDPHSPHVDLIGSPVGNYRSNETLTTQVLKTMVETINQLKAPVSGVKPDLVVITGDLTDNAQVNELDWAHTILDGGRVAPNSGDLSRFFGPGGEPISEHYWNPEPSISNDFPSLLYGMPKVPSLFSAAVDSFDSPGLEMPYLPVHGNHDLLLQGTVVADDSLRELVTGSALPVEFNPKFTLETILSEFSPFGPTFWPKAEIMNFVETEPDPNRDFVESESFSNAFKLAGRYNAIEVNGFLLLSLDSVNENGGWDGSISQRQFSWLEEKLRSSFNQPTLILSHHPFDRMDNLYAKPGAEQRVSGAQIVDLLLEYKNVVAWLAGHEHRNRIERIGGEHGFWHIETCSLIDWPQQGRVIEIFFDREQGYQIVTTMFDHQAPARVIENGIPVSNFDLSNQQHLASLSRELAGNHWQRRSGKHAVTRLEGLTTDRSVFLSKNQSSW